MDIALEKKLYTTYPELFKQRSLPMTQTCMCWGIECGSGWFKSLNDLCIKLHGLSKKYKCEIEFSQIKEKFGTLRVYYSIPYYVEKLSRKVDDCVSEAESISAKTCENCGATDNSVKLRGKGWVYTSCNQCVKEC